MPNYLISPKDIYSAIDDNGNPLTGGQLFTYIAGSSTPADTYTNASGNTKNDNPIILDSRGEAHVWLDDTMVYKFVLRYPASEGGGIIRTTDNISANNGGGGAGISFVTHSDSDTITLEGLGTAGSPLTANALISSITSNALGITTSGGGGMYVVDLSEAIADIETDLDNKLDKVQAGAQSVVSEVTLNEGLILGDAKWMKPTTPQAPIFITNGSNPSGLNSTVQLYTDKTMITSGDGSTQNGQIDMGTGGMNFIDPNGQYSFANLIEETPIKALGRNASNEVVEFTPTDDGENNTSSNVGVGLGLALPKVGVDLPFQSITASGGASVTTNGTEININATTTSAGLVSNVYFQAEEVTIGAGTFYEVSESDKGLLSASQDVIVDDNQKAFFAQDFISDPYDNDGIIKAGKYKSELTIEANSNQALKKFTIEVYLCENDGTPKASGVTGAPIGDLGVQVIEVMESATLSLVANDITQLGLDGTLGSDVPRKLGERIRFHVSGEKVGTAGGSQTLSLYSGLTADSFVEIPATITTNDVVDLSSVTNLGDQTSVNNILNANKLDKLDLAPQSVASAVTFQSGVDVTGALESGLNIKLPSSAYIGNGTSPVTGSRVEFNTFTSLRDSVGNYITSVNITDWQYGANGGAHLFDDGTNIVAQLSHARTTLNALNYNFANVPTDTLAYTYGENASGDLAKSLGGGGGLQDLQSVTDEGNVTTKGATFGGELELLDSPIGLKVANITRFKIGVGLLGDNFAFNRYDANGDYLSNMMKVSPNNGNFQWFSGQIFNSFVDVSGNFKALSRILQGGVTDDGSTGIQALSSKVLGDSQSNLFTLANSKSSYLNGYGQPIIYSTDGSGAGTFSESGNLIISPNIGAGTRDVVFSTSANTEAFKVLRSNGGVQIGNIPIGTQVGLVGYDANGKLIQGSGGGSGAGLKYYPTFNVANVTGGSALSGSYFAVKFIPTADIAVTQFEYYVTSASAGKTVFCGVYNEAGDTLLGESSGNSDAIGLRETTATTAFTLTGGEVYWISILEGSGTPNFGTKAQFADSNLARSAYVAFTPTGMPASITAGTATTTSAYIGVKA